MPSNDYKNDSSLAMPTSKWHAWNQIIQNCNTTSHIPTSHYKLYLNTISQSSLIYACIGGVVVTLVMIISRPACILTDPICPFDKPILNFVNIIIVFLITTAGLILIDTQT
jgi:hypothetical protein